MDRNHMKAYLFVNGATTLWAGNVVLGRALRGQIGPVTLAAVRGGVASVLFIALLVRVGRGERPWTRGDLGLVVAMALSGVVGFQVLLYTGLRSTTALNAGLLNALGPLLTLVVARGILGHRWTIARGLGGVLGLAGVAVISSRGSWTNLVGLRFARGDLVVLAAVVGWVVYSVVGRPVLARHGTVRVTAWSTLLGFLILLGPAALEVSAHPPHLTPSLVAALLYIGSGPSFLAFLAWNEGVKRAGPNGAMAFYNTLPLYAGALAWFALGEVPVPAQLTGGVLVVGGCLLATRSNSA